MSEFFIYYVAFYKHGAPQMLEQGPFVRQETAEYAAEQLNRTSRGQYVVVKQAVNVAEIPE